MKTEKEQKKIFEIEEIKVYDQLFKEYYDTSLGLNEKFECKYEYKTIYDIGKENNISLLEKPKIPAHLSENTVIYLIQNGLFAPFNLKIKKVHWGKNVKKEVWKEEENSQRNSPDIIIELENGDLIVVEVKATGPTKFSMISKKDKKADFLLWVDYSDYLGNNGNQLRVFITEDPEQRKVIPKRYGLKDFILKYEPKKVLIKRNCRPIKVHDYLEIISFE